MVWRFLVMETITKEAIDGKQEYLYDLSRSLKPFLCETQMDTLWSRRKGKCLATVVNTQTGGILQRHNVRSIIYTPLKDRAKKNLRLLNAFTKPSMSFASTIEAAHETKFKIAVPSCHR